MSCSGTHEINFSNGIHFAKDISSEIEKANIVPWKVGLKKEVEISQGLRFFTTAPRFDNESKELLQNKYGVDSWIFRLSRIKRGQATPLGHFYLKFQNMTRNTKNISVSLFYQAAAVSKRFRFFHCPAFSHRKKIQSYKIIPRSTTKKDDLYIRSIERVKSRVSRFKFSPMIISGGRSLEGKYIIDLAFYNEKTKQRYSDWLPAQGAIVVPRELDRLVASCSGIKEELRPLPQSKVPDIQDFEIK